MSDDAFKNTMNDWLNYYKSISGDAGDDKFIKEFMRYTYTHTWYNSLRIIEERAMIKDGFKVLDAGCGWGRMLVGLLDKYTGLKITALDLVEDALEIGKKLIGEEKCGNSIRWVSGNIEDIRHRDGYFDTVYSARVFQHLSHPEKGVSELLRVLRPGGHFVIFLQNKLCPLNMTYYSRLYSPSHVRSWFDAVETDELNISTMDFFPGVLSEFLSLMIRMNIERSAEKIPILNLFGGKVVAWGVK